MIKANKQILSTIQFDCGDDADRFIQKLNIPSTEEEIKALKRAKKTFEQIEFKR